jgi:hypothetical protein
VRKVAVNEAGCTSDTATQQNSEQLAALSDFQVMNVIGHTDVSLCTLLADDKIWSVFPLLLLIDHPAIKSESEYSLQV